MFLPRSLITHLYLHLLRNTHPLSPPVLILVALDPDALCACRILTALLKRDYIPHKIQPVAGYSDLARCGEELVRPMRTTEGGNGGVVVCLGVGGLVDLGAVLGLDVDEDNESGGMGGVEVWVIDARRPWNLGNVFGGRPAVGDRNPERGVEKGMISRSYVPGKGGIIVFDDGDIEDGLEKERNAYSELELMPVIDEDGDGSNDDESEGDDGEDGVPRNKKRKSWSDREEEDESEIDDRPSQRRRSNSSTPISSSPTIQPPRALQESRSPSLSRSVSPSAEVQLSTTQHSTRALRKKLLSLRRKHETVLRNYYSLGTTYSEPVSSLLYSLASELGRDDNDLLWHTIVGVSSMDLYGRTMSGLAISSADDPSPATWSTERGERIRMLLRDEVRRLNPPELSSRDSNRGESQGLMPTAARSPTDTAIRLSPEPRFLLIRHWSLYDSMLHSPYLSARLHVWSDTGRKRLHKLLAKMGVSLAQCRQSYTHMDMDLKRGLRERLLKYAPVYGLDGLVHPKGRAGEGWGFVRSWGWKACLSATDVGVIVGAILEVGKSGAFSLDGTSTDRALANGADRELVDEDGTVEGEEWVSRFWEAYDALENIEALKSALPTAMHLHRAILRTGTSLLEKRQIRDLRAFRMAVVKDGPDVQLFTHPAALIKLALWVGEAIAEVKGERLGRTEDGRKIGKKPMPLVVAGLNETRGVYIVVGTGGGSGASALDIAGREERRKRKETKIKAKEARKQAKEQKRKERREERARLRAERSDDEEVADEESSEESESDESEEDDDDEDGDAGVGRNRFGNAFQEVVEETGARVRIDSFDHCVVEVKKEDLMGFLERLSFKSVVG